jgi:hypothetical protein
VATTTKTLAGSQQLAKQEKDRAEDGNGDRAEQNNIQNKEF